MSKTSSAAPAATTTTPAAGTDADTTAKKKRQSSPANFMIVEEQKNPDGGVVYAPLPLPEGIDLSNPKHRSRGAIEAAVKRNLEEDKNLEHYNGKRLHVIDLGAAFSFRVVETRTTTVQADKT